MIEGVCPLEWNVVLQQSVRLQCSNIRMPDCAIGVAAAVMANRLTCLDHCLKGKEGRRLSLDLLRGEHIIRRKLRRQLGIVERLSLSEMRKRNARSTGRSPGAGVGRAREGRKKVGRGSSCTGVFTQFLCDLA